MIWKMKWYGKWNDGEKEMTHVLHTPQIHSNMCSIYIHTQICIYIYIYTYIYIHKIYTHKICINISTIYILIYMYIHTYIYIWCIHTYIHIHIYMYKLLHTFMHSFFPTARVSCNIMGWLRLVGSIKLQVSFAQEPYKRDDILQKRPVISRRLLIVVAS